MYHITTEFGSMVSTPAFLILLIYFCFIWYTFYIVSIYLSSIGELFFFTNISKATTPDDLNIPNLFPVLTIYKNTCSPPCVRLTILVFDQFSHLPLVRFFLPNPNRSAHKQKAGLTLRECTNSFTKRFYSWVEILSKQLMNIKLIRIVMKYVITFSCW